MLIKSPYGDRNAPLTLYRCIECRKLISRDGLLKNAGCSCGCKRMRATNARGLETCKVRLAPRRWGHPVNWANTAELERVRSILGPRYDKTQD